MDPDTYNWLRVGHVLGFVLWIGGMLALLQLLRVHGAVEGAARDVVTLPRGERPAMCGRGTSGRWRS